ncbi:hypothetical protein L3Y34_017075 [Caenorhabditis briggsae]|uniref:Protein CBR-ZYG-11 n=1 Tax=Caenorhabditis briggsae TaxID=6238 RepID=A0AAE9DGP6_CAEBR|nr:hypothetical protein L3Y34_017075 [Caenorhabditis briggsae]
MPHDKNCGISLYRQSAALVYQDHIPTSNVEFSQDVSNDILHQLNNVQHELSPEIIQNLSKKLHASKFALLQEDFPEEHCWLIYSQNLTELSVRGLNTLWFIDYNFSAEEKRIPVGILALLERLLNSTSMKMLTELEIDGYRTYFLGEWIQILASRLPSLWSLALPYCRLSNHDFLVLCSKFQNLKQLEISSTEIVSLSGIWELVNLEILMACDLELASQEDIEDVFDLKNLRVLDISGDRKYNLKNVEHFWKCRKVLPNLQMLDLSRNLATPQMIYDILTSHPTLTCVGLVATLLDFSALDSLPNPPVILNTITFPNSINKIAHYAKNCFKNAAKLATVLEEIANNHEENLKSFTMEHFQNFWNIIFKIKKQHLHMPYFETQCVRCLLYVYRSQKDFGECKSTILHYLAFLTLNKWEIEDTEKDEIYKMQILTWTLLNELEWLNESTVDVIACRAIKMLMIVDTDKVLFKKLVANLAKAMNPSSEKVKEQLPKNEQVVNKLKSYLNAKHETEEEIECTYLITNHFSPFLPLHGIPGWTRACINGILNVMEYRNRIGLPTDVALAQLALLTSFSSYETGVFLEKERLEMYIKIIKRPPLQYATIALLVSIYLHRTDINNQFDQDIDKSQRAIDRLSKKLNKSYERLEIENERSPWLVFCSVYYLRRRKRKHGHDRKWSKWFCRLFVEY